MRIESHVELSQSRIRIELFDYSDEDLRFAADELGHRSTTFLKGETIPIKECDTSLLVEADAARSVIACPAKNSSWFIILASWMGLSILLGGDDAKHWIEGMMPETPVPYPEPQVRLIRHQQARRVTVLLRIDVTRWPQE